METGTDAARGMGAAWSGGGAHSAGMEMPSGLRKRCAPSRHSGDSSLSPNEPSSSLTCSQGGDRDEGGATNEQGQGRADKNRSRKERER